MGGVNQATAVPPAQSVKSVSGQPVSGSSVRFHEDSSNSEAHFHDDGARRKCALPYGLFTKRYSSWRRSGEDELIMVGHDGSGGRSQVHFHLFPDANGQLDVAVTVGELKAGQTLSNLDQMADFS